MYKLMIVEFEMFCFNLMKKLYIFCNFLFCLWVMWNGLLGRIFIEGKIFFVIEVLVNDK